MPHFEWNDSDMAHSLACFPFVGAVIGAVICLVNLPAQAQGLPAAVRIMLTMLAPPVITGGFHLDGFMDTEDALRSFAGREKKLEILKDPHIGAFAAIGLLRCVLILCCSETCILLHEPFRRETVMILASVFVIGRCFCALTSLLFRKARKDGMLYAETAGSSQGVIRFLIILLLICSAWILYLDVICGAAVLGAFGLYTVYHRYRTYRVFGGVSGDTAGHFLVSSEIAACAVLAAVLFLQR